VLVLAVLIDRLQAFARNRNGARFTIQGRNFEIVAGNGMVPVMSEELGISTPENTMLSERSL